MEVTGRTSERAESKNKNRWTYFTECWLTVDTDNQNAKQCCQSHHYQMGQWLRCWLKEPTSRKIRDSVKQLYFPMFHPAAHERKTGIENMQWSWSETQTYIKAHLVRETTEASGVIFPVLEHRKLGSLRRASPVSIVEGGRVHCPTTSS